MTQFIVIEEPKHEETKRAVTPTRGFALWQLGFRPFYLLASTFAALSIALWAAQLAGWIGHAYLAGPLWHAHEMLFGFVLAVVVGFLFTAGRNWSNRPTPSGWPLAALAALWLAGRVLVLTPFGWAAALANVAFPLTAALALAIPFWAARNRRNYFFVALLLLLACASAAIHLSQLGLSPLPAWAGVQLALDVVLFIMAVMAGRVIPMFTNSGVPGAGAVRHARLEQLALASLLALLATDVLGLPDPLRALVLTLAAAAHALRWALWRPWKTWRTPLVWVLHLAYAWIPLHLALRAAALSLATPGAVLGAVATHALTVGAVGMLTIGMMTRTARGHTARPLRADGFDVACYVLILAAALVRVGAPLAGASWLAASWTVSAALWSAGFGLYALRYGPMLCRARLDGKPG